MKDVSLYCLPYRNLCFWMSQRYVESGERGKRLFVIKLQMLFSLDFHQRVVKISSEEL